MAPDVVLERRHVEIADGDAAQPHADARAGLSVGKPLRHLAVEIELVRKLVVLVGIGNVAAGRDVEIVQNDRIAADVEGGLDVPAILLAAAMMNIGGLERHLGDDRHAIVGLHALDQPVLVTQGLEGHVREMLVRRLGLLQA